MTNDKFEMTNDKFRRGTIRWHSPAMVSGMAGFDGDKSSATGCCHFVVRDELAFDNRPIFRRFDHTRHQMNWLVSRRWSFEFDGVVSGDGAGRFVESVAFHQKVSSRPVAMAIEQCASDASAQHALKRFLVAFGLEVCDRFVTVRETADVQTSFVGRSAAETFEIGSVGFLDAFFVHW